MKNDKTLLNKIVALIEGYKKVQSMYFSSSKDRIENLLTGYRMAKASSFNRLTTFLTEFKNRNDAYTKTTKEKFQLISQRLSVLTT